MARIGHSNAAIKFSGTKLPSSLSQKTQSTV